MNQPAAAMRERPLLDQGAFEQLLAAAFVVQEHNDRLRLQQLEAPEPAPPASASGFTQILAEIVDTQTSIQRDQLDVAAASVLVAERLQAITGASGATVGILENDKLVYRGAAGSAVVFAGSCVASESSLCAYTLRKGQVLVVRDTQKDSRVSPQLCFEQQVTSLVSVPVLHEGKVAGAVELWFASSSEIREHDVRACQLMAGLITDAMNRAAELKWKQVLAAERVTMLAALEKLKPQLERLAVEPSGSESHVPPPMPASQSAEKSHTPAVVCRGCGNALDDSESFCGACGMARPSTRSGDIQSKWASLWYMQQAAADRHGRRAETRDDGESSSENLPPLPSFEELAAEVMAKESAEPVESAALATVEHEPLAIVPIPESPRWHWSSATRTRQWLESLKVRTGTRSFLLEQWKLHRATVYLVVAGLLLIVALVSGGDRDVSAHTSGQRQRILQPQLTTFEKVLVNLGLAVPPPGITTTDLGNPETQVWVDLHTALYYCPGDDLYGKTSEGRFAKQRDAQLEAFQPAARKACN